MIKEIFIYIDKAFKGIKPYIALLISGIASVLFPEKSYFYHLLDEDTLIDEGWLPLEDIQPEYDVETQYLVHDGYVILEDKVVVKYRIEEMLEREPNALEQLTNYILDVDMRLTMQELGL